MTNEAALNGACQIIHHCLGLSHEQELLVVADETTLDVALVILEAAYQLGVSPTLILVPIAMQRRIPAKASLSLSISRLLRDARAIVTCVNATPECFLFRDHILENERGARTKIGHMPGATLDILTMANVDFETLIADCRRLELAMIRGRRLVLISHTANGTEHRLSVDIGGWTRLPIASDGVIREGAWGNVPSGETYIAPVEGSAEGSVVINGSIPGRVIAPDQELVLSFARGRLSEIAPQGSPAADWLETTQLDPARANQDTNWSNLAEIGIGVNAAVTHLTGNMLFDEKAIGTAHIALGSSTFMGGSVQSAIHCDMLITRPTILIDGKLVVAGGELRVKASDWREHYSRVSLAVSPLNAARKFARSGADAEVSDGRLRRMMRTETGRVSYCWVGDDETAHHARLLYECLPENGDPIAIDQLTACSHLDRLTARKVLHIMREYELVQTTNDRKGTL